MNWLVKVIVDQNMAQERVWTEYNSQKCMIPEKYPQLHAPNLILLNKNVLCTSFQHFWNDSNIQIDILYVHNIFIMAFN